METSDMAGPSSEPLNFSLGPDDTDYSLDVFRKATPAWLRTRETIRLVQPARGEIFLDLNGGEAAASYWLSRSGGEWISLAPTAAAAAARQRFLPDVRVLAGLPLPGPEKSVDGVVITDYLHRAPDPAALIADCHRILKPAGRLVVDVPKDRPFSFLRPLQRGLPGFYAGSEFRPGYSVSALFALLKDGFDVHAVRMHSRFFLTWADLLVQRAVARARIRSDSARRVRRLYSVAYPFFLAASWLDRLMVFSRGYRLTALARRHVWREHPAGVRVIGRRLSERVLRPASRRG